MARIGLFGGRFDPIHRAHLHMAQAACEQLGLDQMRWIVTASPIHKPAVASPEDRLAMVGLALQGLADSRMVVDDRELQAAAHGQSNATHVTLSSLRQDFPDDQLIWLLGQDQLEHFTEWRRWDWLIQQMDLAVVARENDPEWSDQSGTAVREELIQAGARIHSVCLPTDAVSSTQVRLGLAESRPVSDLLDPAVLRYIQDKQLYLAKEPGSGT